MFVQTKNMKWIFQVGMAIVFSFCSVVNLQAYNSEDDLKRLFAKALANDTAEDIPVRIQGNGKALTKSAIIFIKHSRKCDNCIMTITPKMIGKKGYLIEHPGEYRLECNTAFMPKSAGYSAIVIDADDVVLDLNHKTLSQGNSTPNTIGILINGNRNVIIKNGTVRSFTKIGIRGNSGINQLLITDVNANNNGSPVATDLDMGGIVLVQSEEIRITDSNFIENFLDGAAFSGCDDLWIENCSFNGSIPCGVPVFGGLPGANGLTAIVIAPPLLERSTNIRITNSTFNNIGGPTGFFCLGLDIGTFDPSQIFSNILIEDCEANNISVSDSISQSVLGMAVFGMNNATLRNCVVNGIFNPNPNANHAHGIETDGSNVLVENCSVFNVVGQCFLTSGYNSETFIGPNKSVVYRNCVTANIQATGPLSRAVGFGTLVGNGPNIGASVFPGIGYIFDSCIAEDVLDTQNLGAGFYLGSMQKLEVKNCSSINNNIGYLMEDITTSPPSSVGVFQHNFAESNTIYGFRDLTTANYSYIGNIARTNGAPGDNYSGSGIPAGTPIRIWTMPGNPAVIDNLGILDPQLDNMDIR